MKKAHVNEVVRNLLTGIPYLVVGMNSTGLQVIDLTDRQSPTPVKVLLRRDWDHYERDIDTKEEKLKEYEKIPDETLEEVLDGKK